MSKVQPLLVRGWKCKATYLSRRDSPVRLLKEVLKYLERGGTNVRWRYYNDDLRHIRNQRY